MEECSWLFVENWNDEDNMMQNLSFFSELEKQTIWKKTEKYVGYTVGYKKIDFCI